LEGLFQFHPSFQDNTPELLAFAGKLITDDDFLIFMIFINTCLIRVPAKKEKYNLKKSI